MLWFHFPAYFFGGVFFANFVPHFVSGVLGRPFPTPFASPPFRGESSPRVNVLYAMANLAVAYAPLARASDFDLRSAPQAGTFALGLGLMALFITRSLARIDQGARLAQHRKPVE